jgi:hypothetical protein
MRRNFVRNTQVGLGGIAQANGLPSSADTVVNGVQTGVNIAFKVLGVPSGSAISILASIPADVLSGFLMGAGVTTLVSGALSAIGAVAPGVLAVLVSSAAVDATVDAVLSSLPILGECLGAATALATIVTAIEGPAQVTVAGPGGNSETVDLLGQGGYIETSIPQAINDTPKYFLMDPTLFGEQESIFLDDLVVYYVGSPAYATQLIPSGSAPAAYAGFSSAAMMIIPGAQSLLHTAQLSAASIAGSFAANILSLFISFNPSTGLPIGTGPTTFPLVSASEWLQIQTAVQPIHDAIFLNAQNWANNQYPAPTDAELNQKYGLVPNDRAAILAAWTPSVGAAGRTGHLILANSPYVALVTAPSSAGSKILVGTTVVGAIAASSIGILALVHGTSYTAAAKTAWSSTKRVFSFKPRKIRT